MNRKFNNFKKLVTSILFSASFILASCGKTSEASGKTIIFWHTFGQDIQNVVQNKIEDFEAIYESQTGEDITIEFEYQGGYDEILDKVSKGFAIGNTPTIAVAYPDHVAEYLALEEDSDRQWVYNLDDFFTDPEIGFSAQKELNPSLKGEEDFVPSFIEEGKQYVKDGTYSLPLMKSSEVLLYNQDLLVRVMKDYDPTVVDIEEYMNTITWDEFMDLLRFISKNLSTYGSGLITPMVYDSDANLFIGQSYQRNIPYVSMSGGKGSIDFNNEQAKAMVEELKGYYDEGLFLTKGTNNNEYGSDTFVNMECIFTVGSTGGAGYNDPGAAGFNVGIAKVPSSSTSEEYNKYVSQGVTLTLLKNNSLSNEVNDERAKIGWQLMKYLTNEENNIDICLASNGYAPVRESCYTNEVYASYLEESDFMPRCANIVANEINGNYFNYPVFRGTATAREQVGGIITQVFLGQETIDEAFDRAEQLTNISM